MLPTRIPSFVLRSAERIIATQATKKSSTATREFAANSLNPGKKALALASICTLTGVAIGISSSNTKEPGIVSNIKEITGLYLQKMGKKLLKEEAPSPTTLPPPDIKIEDPKASVKSDTTPPSTTNSPSLLDTIYNSPAAQVIGYGALGTALACTGLPGAPISFGLMGSKILESIGVYDYLKNQSFAALGITEDPKTKKS